MGDIPTLEGRDVFYLFNISADILHFKLQMLFL